MVASQLNSPTAEARAEMDEKTNKLGRLPPIKSPDILLHSNSVQIQSLHPQNLGRRDARRRTWAAPQRLRALSTVSGIMNDVGYYNHFTQDGQEDKSAPPAEPSQEQEPPLGYMNFERKAPAARPAQRKRTKSLPPNNLDVSEMRDALPWRQKIADGWSYDKYKSTLNSKGSILNYTRPTSAKMDLFIRRKQDKENAFGIAVKCSHSPRLHVIVRRVLMGWQMKGELDAVITWVENIVRHELVVKRLKLIKDQIRGLFTSCRVLHDWQTKQKAAKAAAQAQVELQRKQAAAKYIDFTRGFLLAVDDDDDGGLSWCELKAAEIGDLGTDNPMYAKASIWLMNNRNFQKYDTRNIGIVDETDLVEAMKVFLEDHWKYDGVLW